MPSTMDNFYNFCLDKVAAVELKATQTLVALGSSCQRIRSGLTWASHSLGSTTQSKQR
jgi:hypothetical protein